MGPKPTVGIALQSGLRCATQRFRGHNFALLAPRFHLFASYSFPGTCLPGFTEFLYLEVCTAGALKT